MFTTATLVFYLDQESNQQLYISEIRSGQDTSLQIQGLEFANDELLELIEEEYLPVTSTTDMEQPVYLFVKGKKRLIRNPRRRPQLLLDFDEPYIVTNQIAPLHYDAASDDSGPAKTLSASYVSTNSADMLGNTALYYGTQGGCHERIAIALVGQEKPENYSKAAPAPAKNIGGNTFAAKIASINQKGVKKTCPLMCLFGMFKSAVLSANTSTPITTVGTKVMPASISTRKAIAQKIADNAITGAINGFAPINGRYAAATFAPLTGLYYEAVLQADEHAKISKLIISVLTAAQQPLEAFHDIQLKCLTRSIAEQLRDKILQIKDSNDCDVTIEINKEIKDAEKIKLFNQAISTGLAEADNRITPSPSAPPLEQLNVDELREYYLAGQLPPPPYNPEYTL